MWGPFQDPGAPQLIWSGQVQRISGFLAGRACRSGRASSAGRIFRTEDYRASGGGTWSLHWSRQPPCPQASSQEALPLLPLLLLTGVKGRTTIATTPRGERLVPRTSETYRYKDNFRGLPLKSSQTMNWGSIRNDMMSKSNTSKWHETYSYRLLVSIKSEVINEPSTLNSHAGMSYRIWLYPECSTSPQFTAAPLDNTVLNQITFSFRNLSAIFKEYFL